MLIATAQQIYNIITTSQGKLQAIYPALLAVINNIAAYLQNLSASASSKILHLFSSMSSPGFLLVNESNHDLLRSLLESMNAIIEHQYISKFRPKFRCIINPFFYPKILRVLSTAKFANIRS